MTGGTHPYDDLKAYGDGELTLLRRLTVRLHLARCASCREEMMSMRDLETDLRADSGAMPLDPALRARVLAEAASIPRSALTPPVRPRLRMTPVYVAVSLSAAAIVAAVVIESPSIFHMGSKPAKIAPGVQVARTVAPSLDADGKRGFSVSPPSSEAVRNLSPAPPATADGSVLTAHLADGSTHGPRHLVSAKTAAVPSHSIGAVRYAPHTVFTASVPPDAQGTQFTAGRIPNASVKDYSFVNAAPVVAVPQPSAVPVYAVPPPPPPSVPAPSALPEAKPELNGPMRAQNNLQIGGAVGALRREAVVSGAAAANSAAPAPAASDLPRHDDRQATLKMQVADPEGRRGTIAQIARDLGGAAKSNTSSVSPDGSRSETLVFTVPDVQLGSFLDIVSRLGAVTSRQITTVNSPQNSLDGNDQKTADAATPQETTAGLDKIGSSNDLPIQREQQKTASAIVTVVLTQKPK